ncbi:hypothetical protein CGLO_17503 [Colletotrichum gloeosporioides Cg-14]|uniref:Uncharacterized protein n=1 Tax=Colletotrichum gloeosporioides (strain Cg-14) TaxID=1237896 RepID=T0JTI2_COLGC|nr:hypothetical protein CGLO_17503 [Colletotrichum gloeosporioides Cg-14]
MTSEQVAPRHAPDETLQATAAERRPWFPPEIIDAIIDQIDNHVDLLSMACLGLRYTEYSLSAYYERHFQSRGLPWISRLLWPAVHYDDPMKDEPSPEAEAHALRMMKRAAPFCKPGDMKYHPPPTASDLSYLYFHWKGGIGTGYFYGEYPILHLAAYSGLYDIVEHLVKNGADINATPLQYPSAEDVPLEHLTPLFMASHSGSLKCARLLLDHGARVDLSWAAALGSGNPDLVQLMIDRNPALVHKSVEVHRLTMNPFSAAVDFHNGDPLPVIKTLLLNGADTTYMNAFNRNVHEESGYIHRLQKYIEQLRAAREQEGNATAASLIF